MELHSTALNNMTLMHEHIYLDLSQIKQNPDCLLDDFDAMRAELIQLKAAGVTRICDVTTIGIGRNIAYVDKMEHATGMTIVSSTGCYKEPFLPDFFYHESAQQLAQRFINEIEQGIEGSGRKAQLIGEVGSGMERISPAEKKLLHASSLAANATGKWITTHTSLGKLGLEQVDLFKQYGVDLSRVILGHIDLAGNLAYCLRLLDQGINIECDTIGKTNYLADEVRADLLSELIRRGFKDQLFISMDITRKSQLKAHGGMGYLYLFEHFFPLLHERGVTVEDLDHILRINPQRVFNH